MVEKTKLRVGYMLYGSVDVESVTTAMSDVEDAVGEKSARELLGNVEGLPEIDGDAIKIISVSEVLPDGNLRPVWGNC